MPHSDRIVSLDIMRGLTLILMLIVNSLVIPVSWLGYQVAGTDVMGLADWVFPGFLFIAGMAIPWSVSSRSSNGQDNYTISRHIIIRSVSLIIMGVFILNTGRLNPELTGFGPNLWALIMYLGFILIWNDYKGTDDNFFTIIGLRLAGMALLAFLVFKFKSGEPENDGSLVTGGWGMPGLIGWGYLIAALLYLGIRDNISNMAVAFLFFLSLNILDKFELLSSLSAAKPVFGVFIEGNVPMIVLAGILTTLLLKKYSLKRPEKGIVIIFVTGMSSITLGLILRNWMLISQVESTPGWGLICNGISMIIFVSLYWITDMKKKRLWTSFIRIGGENSLTACIVTNIITLLMMSAGVQTLFYMQSGEPFIMIAGSIIWSLLMVGLTILLVKLRIRLKL